MRFWSRDSGKLFENGCWYACCRIMERQAFRCYTMSSHPFTRGIGHISLKKRLIPGALPLPHTRNPTLEFPVILNFNTRPFRKRPCPKTKKKRPSYKNGHLIPNRHIRIRRLALFRNPSSIHTGPTRRHSKRRPPQARPQSLDHHKHHPALPLSRSPIILRALCILRHG